VYGETDVNSAHYLQGMRHEKKPPMVKKLRVFFVLENSKCMSPYIYQFNQW